MTMKLYYFDVPASVEAARIMIKLADLPCEDISFCMEEWAKKYKCISPSGQCPFMELDDGSVLTQTCAITSFVADLAGFSPTDPLSRAKTAEIGGAIDDVRFPPLCHPPSSFNHKFPRDLPQ